MAENAVIGALRVVLGADTAAFEDGLKKATGSANSFAAGITKIAAGIGLERGIEKAVEGIVHAFKSAVEHADELGKTAQKVGLPVEELSKLSLAAKLSDVSMESLSTGLGKLSKAMVEASTGSGDAAATFRMLGVSVKDSDGTIRSAGDVLADVAGKFEGVKDGAVKTATAIALFGKGGKELIPLLNEGKHGLEEMMHAAEAMGLVISKDTANQAQKLNDNMKLLDAAWQGLVNTVMAGLLPALVRVSNGMADAAKKGDEMRAMADSVVGAVKNLSAWFAAQAEGAKQTALALGELWTAMKQLGSGDVDAARVSLERMNKINQEAPAAMKAAGDAIKGLFAQITVGAKGLQETLDPTLGKIGLAIDDLKFKTAILRHEFDGVSVGFPEAMKAAGVSIGDISKNAADLTGKAKELNTELAIAQAAKFNEEAITSWQLYENQLNRINQAQETGRLSVEAYQAQNLKAAAAVATVWGTTAQAIVSPMAGAFKTLAEMNKQYAGIAKVAAIGEALVNTYLAATKALASVPPPFNFAAAAAVTAAGLVNVAKISATNFAHGGSFKVPGGMSMTDNKFVPLNLAAGEMVDITPANENRQSGGVQEHVFRGIKPNDLYTGDMLRGLIEAINAGTRDGYRINLAAA